MSNKKVISLENYTPEKESKIVIDTNILINIFTPYNIMYNKKTQELYSNLWVKLNKAKCNLLISSVQISEFINRCIRIEFELYKKNKNQERLNYKKDYRPTDDYKEKMNDIFDIIFKDIMPNFTFISDNFDKINKENIFTYGFSYDFNDSLLVEIVKDNNAVLITDDADFGNYEMNFKIVTSNRFLLNMRH